MVAAGHPKSDSRQLSHPSWWAGLTGRQANTPRTRLVPSRAESPTAQGTSTANLHALAACLSRMPRRVARTVLRGDRRGNPPVLPGDAVEAARAALSGRACGAAKSRDGNVEAIRALVVARRSARSAKIQALNQIRHLSFTAPEELRQRLAGVSRHHLAARAAALRPATGEGADPVVAATKTALRILGRRVLAVDEEKARIDALLATLVTQTAPQLLAVFGVEAGTAAALLVTAGDNPGRLRSEAAWAHLCGTAPIPASSGKVTRYRLNRGGDRQA